MWTWTTVDLEDLGYVADRGLEKVEAAYDRLQEVAAMLDADRLHEFRETARAYVIAKQHVRHIRALESLIAEAASGVEAGCSLLTAREAYAAALGEWRRDLEREVNLPGMGDEADARRVAAADLLMTVYRFAGKSIPHHEAEDALKAATAARFERV